MPYGSRNSKVLPTYDRVVRAAEQELEPVLVSDEAETVPRLADLECSHGNLPHEPRCECYGAVTAADGEPVHLARMPGALLFYLDGYYVTARGRNGRPRVDTPSRVVGTYAKQRALAVQDVGRVSTTDVTAHYRQVSR